MRSQLRSLASALTRGLLRVEGRFRARTESRQVLILQYQVALGYCVHMTPVHEALSRAGFKVIVATRGINLELLQNSPFVDEIIETPDPMTDLAGSVRSLRRLLRKRNLRPDCCLTGTADRRTKIVLLGALASPGWRGGFVVNAELYQRPLVYDDSLSRMRNNLRIAELLETPVDGLEPRVFFTSADAARAGALLARAAGRAGTLAVIPCGSGGLPTAWIDERWAAVIRYAADRLGYGIVYLGSARDSAGIDRIQSLSGGIGRSLAGQTTAPELAAVLASCDLVATIDTGGMHVTRAVGTPMVLLGIAWERPHQWLALGREHIRILRGPELEQKPSGYCLEEISVERVCSALTEMAAQFPASAESRSQRIARNINDAELSGLR